MGGRVWLIRVKSAQQGKLLATFEAWFEGAGRGSSWSGWSAPDLRALDERQEKGIEKQVF